MQVTAGVVPHSREAVLPQSRVVAAAHEFEAQLMKELLRPMTSGDDDDDAQTGSGSALSDFGSAALGQALSRKGGFGIATSVLRSLSRDGKAERGEPATGMDSGNLQLGLK